MIRLSSLCLAIVIACLSPGAARTLTDATGRAIDVPDRVERVLPAGQPAAVLIYALAPEKLVGWPRKPKGPAAGFLLPAARALPEIGLLGRDGKASDAVPAETKPDLIIDYGSLASGFLSGAERVQSETGIPYLVLGGELERTPEILRLIGDVLGVGARAEELAREAERILRLTQERAAKRRNGGALRVYYSRSDDGLSTATAATRSTDVLRLLGLVNVAEGTASALPQVTREQVLAWKPEIVFAPQRDYVKAFAAAEWSELPAVQEHRVFGAPRPPFGWIDEPPSVNRLLGLLWVGHLLWPEIYPEDLRQEAKAFYHRFYQVAPNEAQLDLLLR
jgi:iron complex transport system substrate-binding protein